MNKTRSVICTAFILAAVAASAAFAAESDILRQVQDRMQIEQLMWRYVRGLDSGDAEAYAATFTPDGQFGRGADATKGREALKKMITDMRQRNADNEAKGGPKRPPMYHVITNSYVEFIDKDHARLHAYWMTVFAERGGDTPPRVAAAGREIDELVRVNGQWLIKLRDVAPTD